MPSKKKPLSLSKSNLEKNRKEQRKNNSNVRKAIESFRNPLASFLLVRPVATLRVSNMSFSSIILSQTHGQLGLGNSNLVTLQKGENTWKPSFSILAPILHKQIYLVFSPHGETPSRPSQPSQTCQTRWLARPTRTARRQHGSQSCQSQGDTSGCRTGTCLVLDS